jgi:putative endonuclease
MREREVLMQGICSGEAVCAILGKKKGGLPVAWFVYMLRCRDGSLYTGWTTNVEERVKTHNSGEGAKYTRSRLPVKLVYFEELEDRSAALKREAAIKKLTRRKKELLIF